MAQFRGKRVDLVRVSQDHDTSARCEGKNASRDIKDVFPSHSKRVLLQVATEQGALPKEAKRFVSETEASRALQSTQISTENLPSKPLADILREQREQKQAEFEANWKLVKQGQNTPLDEDEAAFLDQLLDSQVQQEQNIKSEVAKELQAFRKAVHSVHTESGEEPRRGKAHLPIRQRKNDEKKSGIFKGIKAKPIIMKKKEHEKNASEVISSLIGDYGSGSDSG
jgi:hypothetical protein